MARLLANVRVDGERLNVGDELPSWAVGKVPAALLSGEVSSAAQKPPEGAFGAHSDEDEDDVRPVFKGSKDD